MRNWDPQLCISVGTGLMVRENIAPLDLCRQRDPALHRWVRGVIGRTQVWHQGGSLAGEKCKNTEGKRQRGREN